MSAQADASIDKPCRLCTQYSFSEQEMQTQIDDYLASLPEHLIVPDAVYQARLRACYQCAKQAQGMCRLCGCYVRTRAAKKTQSCPDIGRQKWIMHQVGHEEE